MSPYLFTLAVDGLSRLVDRVVEVSLFNPLIVGRSNVKIIQLQFADDTIFFSSLEEESLSTLAGILEIFCLIPGMKINLDKSIILGINLEENKLSRLASVVVYIRFVASQIFGVTFRWKPLANGFLGSSGFWSVEEIGWVEESILI